MEILAAVAVAALLWWFLTGVIFYLDGLPKRTYFCVATVPAQRRHFLTAHRQKLGRAKASRPVFFVTGKRLGGASEEGDVDWGVHKEWIKLTWGNPLV